jgi:formylmethanofuran dehydrogenase subunit A
MDNYMITTTDNPFSPFTQYDEWLTWDMARHNTNSLLARVVRTSPELSEADQDLAIQEAIDEIVSQNLSGVHTKVRANETIVPST